MLLIVFVAGCATVSKEAPEVSEVNWLDYRKPLSRDMNIFQYKQHKIQSATITVDLPERPVTQREKNAQLRILDERIEQTEGTVREQARIMRREISFPEHKAFWNYPRTDDIGYLWLEVPESDEEKELQGEGTLYRVLDPEWEYLGVTRAPVRGVVMQVRLLGYITDPETDERIPTVWRLVPQARGFRYP